MSNCPGPECGVFYIAIIDVISISALAGFIMLRASDYYNRKGAVIFYNIMILRIHGKLLFITIFDIISRSALVGFGLLCASE